MRMRSLPFLLPVAVVSLTPAAGLAQKDALIASSFGPESAGLRLAVQVPRAGTPVRFSVKNVGKKPVTFVERYSCSGYSSWWLDAGKTETKLTTHYTYAPRIDSLTDKPPRTVCTRNGPVKLQTVKPGRIATVDVPADRAGLATSSQLYFQGSASLVIRSQRRKLLPLQTPVVRRRGRAGKAR